MSVPSTLVTTTVARSVAIVRGGLASAPRRLAELLAAAWDVLGSGQARNLLLAVIALLGMHLASRVERGEAELARIAEAQGVMGYATMRQLEALGLAPQAAAGVSSAVGGAHAAPVDAPRRAIDPTALVTPPTPGSVAATPAVEALGGRSRSTSNTAADPTSSAAADAAEDARRMGIERVPRGSTATDRVATPARPAGQTTPGAP